MIEINNEYMSLALDGEIIATARFRQHAADNDNGAWIVSTYPVRLLSRSQAITALTLAERLAVGYSDDDPVVIGWRKEVFL